MKIKDIEVKIIQGDITQLDVDAIVTPAAEDLRMDSGLGEFLRKGGGIEIEEEAAIHAPLAAGKAVATRAGRLKARNIIHAVMKTAEGFTDQDILRDAVAAVFERARELNARTLAFPDIAGNGEGFPPVGAAKILAQEIMKCARHAQTTVREVVVCIYDEATFDVFDRTIRGYINHVVEKLGLGPYVTVDIIIEYEGGIVLIERSNPPYGWALPGGFLDYGESLEEAAVREAREETNLDLVDLRQFHTYSAPGRDPRFHTISTVFIAEGVGEPKSGDDAAGLKIVKYADLLQLDYAFDHKEIIEEYLVEKDFD